MITGIGIDLVDLSRFESLADKDTFYRQFLTEREYQAALDQPRRDVRCARIFAAKEAVLKALGCGIEDATCWHSIEITPAMQVELRGRLAAPALQVHLSTAVAGKQVIAYAMAEARHSSALL
jgi:holo-[acyl-carrier protein] synthase